ncbi:hypothetical protein PSPO01_13649 [Paraphaeosphaeria sporulosa]
MTSVSAVEQMIIGSVTALSPDAPRLHQNLPVQSQQPGVLFSLLTSGREGICNGLGPYTRCVIPAAVSHVIPPQNL